MATFDFTFRFRGKTKVVRASGLNQSCAHVDALGMVWEQWGDEALDGARLVKVVEVEGAP